MTSHLEDGTIHELIDGEIASTALGPIREHLAACAECQARLEAAQSMADETDLLIESLDEPATSAPTVASAPAAAARSTAWIRNAAWAASLMVAVGAGYYARGNPVDAVVENATPRETREGPPAGEPLQASRDNRPPPPGAAATAETANRATTTGATDAATGGTTGSAMNDARGRREVSREVSREVPAATGGAVAPESRASAPAPARPALGEGVSIDARDPALRRSLNQARAPEMLPRDQVATKQAADASSADTIAFSDAVRRLGGRLLLIEGMVPLRLELDGNEVRVVYRVNEGELVLTQTLQSGRVSHRLIAPPGFPPDSVTALEKRIKG